MFLRAHSRLVALDAKVGAAHYLTITNRYEIKIHLTVFTSSRHYEANTELGLHSLRFVRQSFTV